MSTPGSHAASPVRALLDRYALAVHDKDAEAFASLYATDVQVFDAWGRWVYQGRDAWFEMARSWFGSVPRDERIEAIAGDVAVLLEGGFAMARGFMVYRAVSLDGAELRSMTNRFTWVLRKSGENWQVIHEHTSVPLDFHTKAMLRSDPAHDA